MSGKLADVEDMIHEISDNGEKGPFSPWESGEASSHKSPRTGERGSTSSRASVPGSPRDPTSQRLAEVKALARDLEGPAQKYPKSGRSSLLDGFRRMHNRHVVAVPRPAQEARDRRTAESEMARWRGGCLGWWETKEEYKKNARPKGYVMLGKILDVKPCATDKKGIIIEHRDQDMTCNLELVLGTPELAKRFEASLKDMLSKLNTPG